MATKRWKILRRISILYLYFPVHHWKYYHR